MLEKLKRLIPDKEVEVIKSLMESEYSAVSFDFRRFDMAFNGYSFGANPDVRSITAERHILNMFRVIFSMGGMVYTHMLPLLVTMYMIRTRNSLPKPVKGLIKENSVYAKVIGMSAFNTCLNRYRLVYAPIVNSLINVPIDADRGVVLSLSFAESTKYFPGERISTVVGNGAEDSVFRDSLKKKQRAFIVMGSGVLCPVTYYNNVSSTMEDL